jgi:SPP1 gp7 family putative phage head morphogenesis protein
VDFSDLLREAMNQPPHRAVAYFRAKGFRFSWNWQDTLAEANDRAFAVTKVMRADVLQSIRQGLDKSLNEGQTQRQFQKDLEPGLKRLGWWGRQEVVNPTTGETESVQLGSPHRLKTIYRTNLQTAYARGREDWALENIENLPYWQYNAVLDARTRPSHAAMDGRVFRADDPVWQAIRPPRGYNCFPAGERVDCTPAGGSKALYSGQIIEIRTFGGNRLAVTPNHPVLTEHGWIAAGQIEEGDNLICAGGDIEPPASTAIDNQYCKALVEDIFDSLSAHGSGSLEPADLDFYGDGQFFQGEIQIVGRDRFLSSVEQATGRKLRFKKSFVDSLAQALALSDSCQFNAHLLLGANLDLGLFQQILGVRFADANLSANHGMPQSLPIQLKYHWEQLAATLAGFFSKGCGDNSMLPQPLLIGGGNPSLPFKSFLLGSTSPFNASFGKQSVDWVTTAPINLGKLQDAVAREIFVDQVVRVSKLDGFHGYVYDFTTANGLIISDQIITSNCRCRITPRSQRWIDRQDNTPVESSEGQLRQINRPVSIRSGLSEQVTVLETVDQNGNRILAGPDPGWSRDWQPDLERYAPGIRAQLEAALAARQQAVTLPTGIEIPVGRQSRYRAESEAEIARVLENPAYRVVQEVTREGGYVVRHRGHNRVASDDEIGRLLARQGSRVVLRDEQGPQGQKMPDATVDGEIYDFMEALRPNYDSIQGKIKKTKKQGGQPVILLRSDMDRSLLNRAIGGKLKEDKEGFFRRIIIIFADGLIRALTPRDWDNGERF